VIKEVRVKILPAEMRTLRILAQYQKLVVKKTYSPAVALTVKTPPWM
jgi:hypothetical protein